jgi:hypothetical protein
MIKGLLFIIVVWLIVANLLDRFWHLTGKEKLSVAKCIGYGLLTAVITFGLITTMVVIF